MRNQDARVHEKDVYFIIQRGHWTAEDKEVWVDASGGYWHESGESAALAQRDTMRETFGKESVRVVRRDILIIETTVE